MGIIQKWLERRAKKLASEVADKVTRELTAQRGWEKFLPPVVLRDTVYMVTENGSIYAMRPNLEGMEQIIEIRRN